MKQGDGLIANFSQLLSLLKNPRLNKWYNGMVKLLVTQGGSTSYSAVVKGLTFSIKVLYNLLYFLK